jgi:3-oxoacyl-[acyl-carrier protein] reductase
MLKDEVALVTGSSRGIGRAVSLALARSGADVAVNCRRSEEEGRSVCEAIKKIGSRTMLALGDTRWEQDVDRVVSMVEEHLGPVDILVNNAAYALCKPFLEYTAEEWKAQLAYKGLAYFLTARRVLPSMIHRGSGAIINVLSAAALRDGAGELAYAATNGAAAALTRGLASEFGQHGIRVNAILLTWADNAFDAENPDHIEWLDRFALGRVTRVEEVGRVAAFLASPAASGITGALVPVDAGFLCC